eukprot:1138158-Pelagomonas_calceolata.AAC.2
MASTGTLHGTVCAPPCAQASIKAVSRFTNLHAELVLLFFFAYQIHHLKITSPKPPGMATCMSSAPETSQ